VGASVSVANTDREPSSADIARMQTRMAQSLLVKDEYADLSVLNISVN
jgi:hypothetical protein